ncbi:MAG: cardiolipin synthase [Lachnospiraceae bacterium]|nr:cardiolipin synthase [Lachnospiraceae bacterium]
MGEKRIRTHKRSSPEKRAARKNGIFRMVTAIIAISFEIFLITNLFTRLNAEAEWINMVTRALALVLVIFIYNEDRNAAFKIPWIILIMVLPVFGIIMYLLIGLNAHTYQMKKRYRQIDERLYPMLDGNDDLKELVSDTDPAAGAVCNYLHDQAHFPVYVNSQVRYFGDTTEALSSLLSDLRSAENFIFMEYFAIDDKEAWKQIEEILVKKVKDGVEVRVFYDDLGSIGFINTAFSKKLNSLGIKCRVFNPFFPGLNRFLNNRDHRKITVIDGRIAHTGGYNLADEYFNIERPYRAWKDCGIRITGQAVDSMTVIFLENWNATKKNFEKDQIYDRFLVAKKEEEGKGFVVPFADSPMDELEVGEDVYITMLSKANSYAYIMTPYLIITDELKCALSLAAMRGVDVRIITPGIPDKKVVYSITRSFYHDLCKRGVRIYEWRPGFMHGKMMVCDDSYCFCGTINFDYRSFYHHFENGVFFGYCDAVIDAKEDFLMTAAEGEEVTLDYRAGRKGLLKLPQMLLRLFAELL